MAKIVLSNVPVGGCVKPKCGNRRTHRHHMRNQHLFVVHFKETKRGRKYSAFVGRYQSFHKDDVVHICPDHHEEIHRRWDRILMKHIRANGYKPLCDWTWKQAEDFMDECYEWGQKWLHRATPGVKNHKRVWS